MNRLLILLTLTIFSSTLKAQKVKGLYHPKEPFERRTDTVINSNNVTWNFRSAPNSYVIQEYQDGDKLFRCYYRDATFDIVLPTTKLTFDKMSFNKLIDFDYSSDFIWYRTYFEGFDDSTNELKFFISITKPETDWTYPIYLFVNMNGTTRMELMEYEDDY